MSEPPADRAPQAEALRPVPRWRPGRGDPERPVRRLAANFRRAASLGAGFDHERREERPFLAAHQVASHDLLPSKGGALNNASADFGVLVVNTARTRRLVCTGQAEYDPDELQARSRHVTAVQGGSHFDAARRCCEFAWSFDHDSDSMTWVEQATRDMTLRIDGSASVCGDDRGVRTFKIIVRPEQGSPDPASGFVGSRDEAPARAIVPSLPGRMISNRGLKLRPGRPDRFSKRSFGLDREMAALIEAKAGAIIHAVERRPKANG